MGKQREGERWLCYRRALISGFAAAGIFLIMVFLIACISETKHALYTHGAVSVKICLAVSAFLCALISAGRSHQNRLPYALTGEAVFLVMIGLIGITLGMNGGWKSVALDVGIMLFGAFAGALSHRGHGRKRRGKR